MLIYIILFIFIIYSRFNRSRSLFVLRYSRYSARMRMRDKDKDSHRYSNAAKTDIDSAYTSTYQHKKTKTDIPQHTQPIYPNLPQLKNGKYDPKLLQNTPNLTDFCICDSEQISKVPF